MSQCRSRSPGHFAVVLDSSLTFRANYVHVAVTLKDPHSTVPLSSLQVFDLGADLVHVLLEDLPKSKARQRQYSVTRRSCQLTHHSDRKYHPHLIFTTESKRGLYFSGQDGTWLSPFCCGHSGGNPLFRWIKSREIRVLGGPCRRLINTSRVRLEGSGPGGVRSAWYMSGYEVGTCIPFTWYSISSFRHRNTYPTPISGILLTPISGILSPKSGCSYKGVKNTALRISYSRG